MNKKQEYIRRVFFLFAFLFAVFLFYFVKLVFADGRQVATNSYNKRMFSADSLIMRGNIYDKNGKALAVTLESDAGYIRNYPYGRVFAHVVGYTDIVKAGVESSANFDLQTLDNEIMQRYQNIKFGTELRGNDVVLTLDAGLQELLHSKMKKLTGSAAVIEPSSGKILAMCSFPDFDPNNMSDLWLELNADSENRPLVNRAAQALYEPGSTAKIITALAAIKNYPKYNELVVSCTGQAVVEGHTVNCHAKKGHGEIGFDDAFANSCNIYYAVLGEKTGAENLKAAAEQFMFNKPIALSSKISSYALSEASSAGEIYDTAFGQGRTLATPLQMALVAGAVANSGVMMRPYVIDRVQTADGRIVRKNMPEMISVVCSIEEAAILNDLMVKAVESGTGSHGKIDGITVAAKTGTAQNPGGAEHSWFIAFAPAENPVAAVVVMLENSGSSNKPAQIAAEVLKYVIEKFE